MSGEDPLLSVASLTGRRDGRVWDLGRNLENAYESLTCNAYMVAYLTVCLLVLLLFASPYLLASENTTLRNIGAFMHVSAGVLMLCHQLPYRSFIFNGIPMAVCARDVGIYAGAILGFATIMLNVKPKILSSIKLLILATIPIALDGVTQTVLVMRESNNIIRLATGLIFGLGVMAYVTQILLERRHPKFRQHVTWTALAFDITLATLLVYIAYSIIGAAFSIDYMGSGEARMKALAESEAREPVEVKTYYVSSMTPLSIQFDPYYERYKDLILEDIKASEWAKARVKGLNNKVVNQYPTNKTLAEMLDAIAYNNHNFGIWAVAVLDENPAIGDAPYITSGKGKYYYFDGLTGKLIMETRH
ncbi:MAG: DUF2085 domain-containing protein [Candidatus Altiarchaeota archaeon]